MRLETPDGKTVSLRDGNERELLRSDVDGKLTVPVDATFSGTLGVSSVTSGGVAVGVTMYRDVTVAAAAVKTLNATPVSLVPAPGTGLANVFEGAVMMLDYGTAAYDGVAAGEDLSVKYTNGSGLEVAQCEVTGFLDQTSDQVRYVRPHTAASANSAITPVANAALVLHMLTSEIATGDSPLKVRTYYRVVPTVL